MKIRISFCIVGLFLGGYFYGEEKKPDPSVVAETLLRLKDVDLEKNPQIKAAVLKALDSIRGTPQFVEIVRLFQIKDRNQEVLAYACQNSSDSNGVEAMRWLLDSDGAPLLQERLATTSLVESLQITEALGNTRDKRIIALLLPILTDTKRDALLRKQSLRALAKSSEGAATLIAMTKEEKLPSELILTATDELNQVPWPEIQAEAAKLLPFPKSKSGQPMPPRKTLLKIEGDATRGAAVFMRDQSSCTRCHALHGKGGTVGPDLSEIGDKLGKEALYEAILDPSAAISVGFEAWMLELQSGDQIYGIVVSETEEELDLKDNAGIVTRYPKTTIVKRVQSKLSIMPAGLLQTMSSQDFSDLLQFLASLRKNASP